MPSKKKGSNKKKSKGKDGTGKNEVREFGNRFHSVHNQMTGQLCDDAVTLEAKRLLDDIQIPMPIPETEVIMRKITTLAGTDVQRNDDDPFGNGDQSPCGELGFTTRGEQTRQILRTLFGNGGDLNSYLMFDGFTKFAYACVIGDATTVKGMLTLTQFGSQKRMELLERRETGMRFPPLILTVAMFKSRFHVSQVLHVPERQMDHFTTFKLLLEYGADPSCKEMTGKTVIHYGAGSYAQELTLKMAEYCIDAFKTSRHFGQNVTLRNLSKTEYNGRTGKLGGYLAETGRRQVVLEDGKELSLLPKNIYVQVGESEEERDIYDTNQNLVNDQDRVGMISMHEVFMSQRVDVARFLTRHKVNIDIADHGEMSIRKMAFTGSAVSDMHSLIRKYGTQQSKSESKQCLYCGIYDDQVLICSRCKHAAYCSPECQKKHWKEHKKICQPAQITSVVLSKPPLNSTTDPSQLLRNNRDGSSDYGGYQLPEGVVPQEKFWMKVQVGNGPLLLYDKSRSCGFLYNPNQVGFSELKEKVQEETAYVGKKAYLKASFGEDGKCTIYLNETSLKKW